MASSSKSGMLCLASSRLSFLLQKVAGFLKLLFTCKRMPDGPPFNARVLSLPYKFRFHCVNTVNDVNHCFISLNDFNACSLMLNTFDVASLFNKFVIPLQHLEY